MNAAAQRLFERSRIKRDLRTPDDRRTGPAFNKLDEIARLRARSQEELAALERSLALDAMWPGLFDGPRSVTTSWHGRPDPAIYIPGEVRYKLALHVTNARGLPRVFEQADVPECLWPNAVYGTL